MSWRVVLNSFIVLLLAGALSLGLYHSLARVPAPCEEPITYTIGTFDKRFGISQKDFLGALTQAESIWEKPIGKELFIYDPQGGQLLVNLIYDNRQETTNTLSSLGSSLAENETNYKMLQNQYVGLKAEYEKIKSNYESQVAVFDEKNLAYQQKVSAWNDSNRSSREQFAELEQEKNALENDVTALKTSETALNDKVREINTLVGTLNTMAKSLNLSVKEYNTIGASRGETFTGGVYVQNNEERYINVYEFSNREKLVRILAHELGHALGLEHNNDPKAIMYYLNEGEAEAPTQTDLAALKALCYNEGIKN